MGAGMLENRIPVIKGWIHMDKENYHLIGNRCNLCGEYFFPKAWISGQSKRWTVIFRRGRSGPGFGANM